MVLLRSVTGIGWILVRLIISNENVGTNCSFLGCCAGVGVVCLGIFGTRLVPSRGGLWPVQSCSFAFQSCLVRGLKKVLNLASKKHLSYT